VLAAAFSPVAPLRACAGRRGEAGAPGVTPELRVYMRSCAVCGQCARSTAKCMLVWTIIYAHDVRSGHEHVRGHHIGVPARRARPLARPLANYEGEGGPMALDYRCP
jgi:hypothetical protein